MGSKVLLSGQSRFDSGDALIEDVQIRAHEIGLPDQAFTFCWIDVGKRRTVDESQQLFELVAQVSAFVEQAVLVGFEILQGVLLGRVVVG